jgi:hypothetical protein
MGSIVVPHMPALSSAIDVAVFLADVSHKHAFVTSVTQHKGTYHALEVLHLELVALL